MKDKMSKAGYVQGDMSPKVDEYQKPTSDFSQSGFSRTTDYIERQDRQCSKAAGDIRKQGYEGRYS